MMIRLELLWGIMFLAFLTAVATSGSLLWIAATFAGMNLAQLLNDRLRGPFEQFTPGKVYEVPQGFVFQAVCSAGQKYVYPEFYTTRRAAEKAQKSFCRTPRSWNHIL